MFHPSRQKGMVTLMMTVVVLLLLTLTTLYTARVVMTDDKVFAQTYRDAQALDAARSGFAYALGFLNSSLLNQEAVRTANTVNTIPASVLSGNLNGCASASTTITLTSPGALANGATYVMTYRCITANDVNTISIRSVGTSADGSATRTVEGTVQRVQPTNATLISIGTPGLTGGANIVNTVNNATHAILTNSASATITGGGTVTTSAGSCTSSATCVTLGALTLSDPNLSSLTTAALFETRFMGNTLTSFSTQADYVLTCNSDVTYTSTADALTDGGNCGSITAASGVTPADPTWAQINATGGRVIYYNMGTNDSITFSGFTAGSATSPNIIIVSSDTGEAVTLGNTAVFYGGIYTVGLLDATGNSATNLNGIGFTSNDYTQDDSVDVNGIVMVRTTPAISASGTLINRNSSTILSYIMGGSVLGYALVPGSLRDFTIS